MSKTIREYTDYTVGSIFNLIREDVMVKGKSVWSPEFDTTELEKVLNPVNIVVENGVWFRCDANKTLNK